MCNSGYTQQCNQVTLYTLYSIVSIAIYTIHIIHILRYKESLHSYTYQCILLINNIFYGSVNTWNIRCCTTDNNNYSYILFTTWCSYSECTWMTSILKIHSIVSHNAHEIANLLWNHTHGKVLSYVWAFIHNQYPKLIQLHLFIFSIFSGEHFLSFKWDYSDLTYLQIIKEQHLNEYHDFEVISVTQK